MKRLLPELPLLRRELTELANRRRTYIVRVIGACILLFFVFVAYQRAMLEREQLIGAYGGFAGPERYLGIGGAVFSSITPMLFFAIQLLMPAFCCAAMTAEKENNTIGTLLLTKLSPGTIILEKVGSRIVPMLTILLLAFPVLAHVHSLGGVDTDLLIGTIWLLLAECFLIASVSILFSAWFATTTAAFVWSYVFIGFMLMLSISLEVNTFLPSAIWNDVFYDGDMNLTRAQVSLMQSMGMLGGPGATQPENRWMIIIARTIPSWFATALLLLVARLLVVRRAFVSQSSVLLKLFRYIDQFFKALNDRTTGGIEIIKDSNPLPDSDPVAWRERTKKSLGKARYLFRILILLEVPTLFICVMTATISARSAFQGLFALECLILVLATLIAAVKAATLFSSERARETIEPLLATPMLASELVSQKVAGMRRLVIVLATPILTVTLTHFLLSFRFSSIPYLLTTLTPLLYVSMFVASVWWLYRFLTRTDGKRNLASIVSAVAACAGLFVSLKFLFFGDAVAANPWVYLLISTIGTFTMLYLVAWVATGISLKIHSQTRSSVAAVAFISVWTVTPPIICMAFAPESPMREVIMTLSPYSIVEANERYLSGTMYFGFSMNYTDETGQVWWKFTLPFYACVVALLYRFVHWRAPALLNRRESRRRAFAELPVSHVTVLEGSKS